MSEQGQPQNAVQASGKAFTDLIGGFQGAPTLLLIVILQLAMMIIAGWYLTEDNKVRGEVTKELVILIRGCILETAPITAGRE